MLKIDVAVHPMGDEQGAYGIEELYIWNTTQEREAGEYYYRGSLKDPRFMDNKDRDKCAGVWHYRKDSALKLTALIVEALENKNEQDEGDKVSK